VRNTPADDYVAGAASAGDIVVMGIVGKTIIARAMLPNCSPDLTFGTKGTSKIVGPHGSPFEMDAMIAGADGSVIVTGNDGPAMVVGHLLANGRMDQHFGDHGWASLVPPDRGPFPTATAAIRESSGEIVLAGSEEVGCKGSKCHGVWVTAVTATGKLDTSFGQSGWAHPFTGAAEVDGLIPQPHNEVLVMGGSASLCGLESLALLNSMGEPVQTFEPQFSAAWKQLEPADSFFGTVYPRSGGFGIVGLGLGVAPCQAGPDLDAAASGLLGGFHTNGTLDTEFGQSGENGVSRFSSTYSQVWAVPLAGGDVAVVIAPQQAPFVLTVAAYTSGGALDTTFGRDGTEQETLSATSATGGTTFAFGEQGGVAVVSPSSQGLQIRKFGGTTPTRSTKRLSAALDLKTTQVVSGHVIRGVMIIDNRGTTMNVRPQNGCGRLGFAVILTRGDFRNQEPIGSPGCSTPKPLLIPHGVSRYPFTVRTSYWGCSPPGGSSLVSTPRCPTAGGFPTLPAGTYEAVVQWETEVRLVEPTPVAVVLTAN